MKAIILLLLLSLIFAKINDKAEFREFIEEKHQNVKSLAKKMKELYESRKCDLAIRNCEKCSYDGNFYSDPDRVCYTFPTPENICNRF